MTKEACSIFGVRNPSATTKSKYQRASSFLRRLRTDTGGNALAMMAAALIPLAGVVGGALDISRAYVARAKLQNACDASALAARQAMTKAYVSNEVRDAGKRFFKFNFPDETMGAKEIKLNLAKNKQDPASLDVSASAKVPTSLMRIFGKDHIPIDVNCDVTRDIGNNDVMLVLDVTGSMNCLPGQGGGCSGVPQTGSKLERLQAATLGMYRAVGTGFGNITRTRFGIMPYSGTVNVGRHVHHRGVMYETSYQDCTGGCAQPKKIDINDTNWYHAAGSRFNRLRAWQNSGNACIEERSSIGNAAYPILISSDVSQDDIDLYAHNGNRSIIPWGRYDPNPLDRNGSPMIQPAHYWSACPGEAQRLTQYKSESDFKSAVNTATAIATGATYHDIGMIWGMRFLSSTGMFGKQNPEIFRNNPVSKHIVFMTDGQLYTSGNFYSAYGVDDYDNRMTASGSRDDKHRDRFLSACARARSMEMTVWVIALDVNALDQIRPCASSADHFYTSDGYDLEQIFTRIGQKIGGLRLTS